MSTLCRVYSQAERNCVIIAAGIRKFFRPGAVLGSEKFPNTGALEVRGTMSHPFLHPQGRELLKRVAQLFKSEQTYVLRDSNIVFVCGGSNEEPSMRKRFLEYARAELPHLRMFLAEDAEKDFVTNAEEKLHNVGEFEEIIGEISDCLIIFPESPGSFAELGFFAKNEELRKKILVVNDENLQSKDSFLRRGPINLIDAHSRFAKEIQVRYDDNANFGLVKERLETQVVGKNRKKFAVTKYADLTFRKTFFAIFEIIRIFEVMSLEAVEYAFRSVFGNVNPTDVRELLSILVAARLVRRDGDDQEFFCINREAKPFMEFDQFDVDLFRLEVLDFYNSEFPQVASVAKGLSDAR